MLLCWHFRIIDHISSHILMSPHSGVKLTVLIYSLAKQDICLMTILTQPSGDRRYVCIE